MRTCNPLHAGLWFKWKPIVNIGVAIVTFIILIFGLGYFFQFWIAAIISGIVALCFYLFYPASFLLPSAIDREKYR